MNIVLFTDTGSSMDLYAAIPATIIDPFLFVEADGRKLVVVSSLDAGTVREAAPDVEVVDPETYGRRELRLSGMARLDVDFEVARRALAATDFHGAGASLPAAGETTLRTLLADPGGRVAGYTVEVFYP